MIVYSIGLVTKLVITFSALFEIRESLGLNVHKRITSSTFPTPRIYTWVINKTLKS